VSLAAGTRLGSYEIVAPLGAGGMGEVYVARDARLGRDVAIKILPAASTADPARRARLEREARVLAALNHPNIAAIFGVEDIQGGLALILELAPGQTLEDRLRAGPLPVREALAVARQIADALDAAHERGIIHRDLKPANIALSPAGVVKVLDFGLAVAIAAPASSVDEAPTQQQVSIPGLVVGTPAYMSPEQARGQAVDKRVDVWAFGCVLFAMLTGRAPFGGETVTDTLAAVLEHEPAWRELPAAAAPFTRVLQRCLEKDVRRRFRDIADMQQVLDDTDANRVPVATAPRVTSTVFGLTVAALVVLGLLGAVALNWTRPTTAAPPRFGRFELVPAADAPLTTEGLGASVAISPDGSRIVYTALRNGSSVLVLRRIDQLEATPIAGTEGGTAPFFSPDGQQIGFATLFDLRRVPTEGGPSVRIARTDPGFRGATWAPDNSIVYAQDGGVGLIRIPVSGGSPEKVAAPDASRGEEGFVEPSILPGGRAVLYTVLLHGGKTRVIARALTGEDGATTVVEGGFGAKYLASGHLAFGQGDRLMAARFDLAGRRIIGAPVAVQESAFTNIADGVSNLATAADGTAVYVTGHNAGAFRRLVWVDRQGARVAAVAEQPQDGLRNPRLSPDERRVAVTIGGNGNGNIWIYDLSGAARSVKLTFQGHNTFPIWSTDGKRIAFLSAANATNLIVSLPADGSSVQPEPLVIGNSGALPLAWSPDGQFLLFAREARLWLMNVSDRKPVIWLPTPFTEFGGRFSPDGKWIAFASLQNGQLEVWVRPFPGPGAPVRVSSGGGHDPVWARDGNEIFYTNGPKLSSARVLSVTPDFRVEAPRVLFEGGFVHDDTDPGIRFLDTARDGRLLMIEAVETAKAASMIVVEHWDQELKRVLPAK
jgi:Tol biopolymer transport system component